jgi:hypothetical protein
MQGVKYKYSVDELKVCYEMKSEFYNKLTENPLKNTFFVLSSPNCYDIFTEYFI